ncbi:MAG: hypothetical protein PHI97_25975 [Desulfobulbus sp.]|nr:hypothetical protein [Desulfobulbus sp.]
MSIWKKIGKSILVAGIFMILATPVMAGKGAGTKDGTGPKNVCSCLASECGCPADSPCLDL